MKAVLPKPVHESYRRHRKQRLSQIILPMVLGALLFIGLVVLILISAFSYNNPAVGRWAAVSTIWISIPVCIVGFIFIALLFGLVYLLGRLLGIAPVYTGKAQDFVHKLAIHIRRIVDMTVRPIISVNSVGATVKALFGRK